jgi:putative ABC transport system substrate-binding protein
MNRRVFVTGLGALLVAPSAAEAQQAGKVYRIGILSTGSVSSNLHLFQVFQQQLRELGYIEGQNIAFEFRGADGKNEQLPARATDLVKLKVDVVVTVGTPAAAAAKQVTSTIPIVTAIVADPVGAGLVTSLARPGGNLTGIADLDDELTGKRLGLLKEAVPGLAHVALMWKRGNPAHKTALREAEVAARTMELQLQRVDVGTASELQPAFVVMARARVGALILAADSMFAVHVAQLLDAATKSRLPTMFWRRDFVAAGGLMSYGTVYPELFRRAAVYVDRVLKGAKPADLPMEQPTKFELVINLKTAKALGLTIPPSLLLRADQVIE